MSPPTRTCIGCREATEAGQLVRIVRLDDGSLAVGRTLPGRGAWLHASTPACLESALRRKAFGRAFRAPISDGAPESLRVLLAEHARIGSCEM